MNSIHTTQTQRSHFRGNQRGLWLVLFVALLPYCAIESLVQFVITLVSGERKDDSSRSFFVTKAMDYADWTLPYF